MGEDMENSVKGDGAEKAIELGLDDLEAIAGGTYNYERREEKDRKRLEKAEREGRTADADYLRGRLTPPIRPKR